MLSFDNLMITVGTIVAALLLYVVPRNFDFLSPVGAALSDLDITDMVFSKFRSDDRVVTDTSIVLVNIGELDRAGIAAQVVAIAAHQPAVIGIDAFFRAPKDSVADSTLAAVMEATPNIVLVSKLERRADLLADEQGGSAVHVVGTQGDDVDRAESTAMFDTLITSMPRFAQHARRGFANLVTVGNEQAKTCREVSLQEPCAGRTEFSFPIELVRAVAPEKADAALRRGNPTETINYIGDQRRFFVLDVDDVLDPEADLSMVRGKIVIMGFLGDHIGDRSIEDKLFTPMNEHYVGRSIPDMFGAVIHANVVSMILRQDFVWTMLPWQKIGLALVLLVFNVFLFTYIYTRHENWYDVLALVTQLSQSIGLLVVTIWLFDGYAIKLDPTSALFGVFLVGPVHDLYQDSIKKIILAAIDRAKRRASKRTRARTDAPSSTKDTP